MTGKNHVGQVENPKGTKQRGVEAVFAAVRLDPNTPFLTCPVCITEKSSPAPKVHNITQNLFYSDHPGDRDAGLACKNMRVLLCLPVTEDLTIRPS
jgi:hypothetical protein